MSALTDIPNGVEKVIDTLFSIELGVGKGIEQLNSFRGWISDLREKNIITADEKIFIDVVVTRLIEKELKILQSNGSEKVAIKELVPIVSKVILDYFNKECYDNRYHRVYDLPLNINLIEAAIDKDGYCVKVYLQRPGLLIGKGGRCIDAITDIVRKQTGLNDFHILIVETYGYNIYGEPCGKSDCYDFDCPYEDE